MDLFSIEKTNVTGNPAILNDSAKMALQGLTVYGRSNQTKTTGAQLFASTVIKKYKCRCDINTKRIKYMAFRRNEHCGWRKKYSSRGTNGAF